jgi:hypothetical protein
MGLDGVERHCRSYVGHDHNFRFAWNIRVDNGSPYRGINMILGGSVLVAMDWESRAQFTSVQRLDLYLETWAMFEFSR